MTRAAKKIHAFRTSGTNAPGYSQPPVVGTQQPADATTVQQALDGLRKAAEPKLVKPRFRDTSGSWLRLGAHETRVPGDVAISTTKARDGRHIAIVAHLDESENAGKVQVLVSTEDGVRELVGLSAAQLRELRREHFGK